MESVEKWGVFDRSVRKTVENSVENVEKGLFIRWILGEKSGKFISRKLSRKNKKAPLKAVANCTKNIKKTISNKLILTKFDKSYCKLKKTL